MISELLEVAEKNEGKDVYVRIHSDGDFFEKDYFLLWWDIVNDSKIMDLERLHFMAYTKEIKMIEECNEEVDLKKLNMKIVFSYMDNKTDNSDLQIFEKLRKEVNEGKKPRYYMNRYTVYRSDKCSSIKDDVVCKNQCWGKIDTKCKDYQSCCDEQKSDSRTKSDCAHCLKCYSASSKKDIGVLDVNIREYLK